MSGALFGLVFFNRRKQGSEEGQEEGQGGKETPETAQKERDEGEKIQVVKSSTCRIPPATHGDESAGGRDEGAVGSVQQAGRSAAAGIRCEIFFSPICYRICQAWARV